jgi:hypothetical protein
MTEGDERYRPTEGQLERRERLTGMVRQAMRYSDELTPAVVVMQEAALVSVDVTRGEAADADLRAAADDCLRRLDDYVDVHPMRRELRKVIDQIDSESIATGGGDYAEPAADEANELIEAGDLPRKERSG